ncbi:MAG: hypothetical protein JNJ59_14050 [Deltaproteobacteria bacterium]|nr:hypothetical protein [Deltaproteobacteria bacterium]
MTTERGPVLRKRGNAPSPPPEPPPEAPPPAPRAPERRPLPRGVAPTGRDAGAAEPRARTPEGGQAMRRDVRTGSRGGEAPKDTPRPASPGRRLYDPKAERGGAPAAPAAPARDAKGAKKPFATGAGRPLVKDEKSELKAQAQKLAKDKGVPLVHAYRILKGQTTLNDVLKGMMRKERFEQLVAREGVDRELAGQVASGHLPKQRAVLLTRMRTLRKQKLHIDGIKAAEVEKKRVGLDIFGRGWVLGRVRAARPYDFDFLADGADKAEKLFKHEVKAVCYAEDLDAAKRASSQDEVVTALALASTEDRGERVRPTDDAMLLFIDDQRIVRFTMRDGEQLLGRLRSFGRWDAELVLDGGETITVFFHGLHATSVNLGHQV